MKSRFIFLSIVLAGILKAQTPTITQVVNAASLEAFRLTPGTLALVVGANFGTSTSIPVTVGGKAAVVTNATSSALAVVIPSDAPLGSTTIQVGTSAPFAITLSKYGPALFALSGALEAFHQDGSVLNTTSPAKPGETISIVGTGWGPADPKPTVTINGQPATVVSSELLTNPAGFNRATLVVPCVHFGNQPVVLTAGALASKPLPLPIAPTTTSGPQITPRQVVSAVGYVPLTATSGIAQGSYFYIGGCGIGSDKGQGSAIPYTTNFADASVTIAPSIGPAVQAYVQYVDAGQINAILPSTTPVGDATVTVTYKGVTSPPEKIRIVRSNFRLASNGYPVGPAAIINLNTPVTLYNLLTNAANTGDLLELYGTGLGPISIGDSVAPHAAVPADIDVKVLVGDQVVTPIYAGRSFEYPALDQVVFQLPANLPDSCFIPIAVQVNGAVSNYGTFSKSTGNRTCPAPLGLSPFALQRLDQGAKLNVGVLSLSRITLEASLAGLNISVSTEQAGGAFAALDASGILGLAQTPGAAPPVNPPGTCIVQTIDATNPPTTTVPALPIPLNAGAKLTLSGPDNKTADLPNQGTAGYGAFLAQGGGPPGIPISSLSFVPQVPAGLPATFIQAGPWSIRGTGGTDVSAFTALITVPADLVCATCAAISTIDRTKPVKIDWTGGGAQDYVQIGGISTSVSLADPNKNIAVVFACNARAADGTFTVPVSVLSQMPAASGNPAASNIGALAIVNGAGNASARFGNLDAGYFGYTSMLYKLVGYN